MNLTLWVICRDILYRNHSILLRDQQLGNHRQTSAHHVYYQLNTKEKSLPRRRSIFETLKT